MAATKVTPQVSADVITSQESVAPQGTQPGGSWYLLESYSSSGSPPIRVRHVSSGYVMIMEDDKLLVYHDERNGCYYDTYGAIVAVGNADGSSSLTRLHADLVPVLPPPMEATADAVIEGEEPLSDSPDCRPPGTLAGGSWFQEAVILEDEINKARRTTRLLYKEVQDGEMTGGDSQRYYTQAGTVVTPNLSNLIAVSTRMSTSARSSGHHAIANIETKRQKSSAGPLVRGPPGTRHGGKWYKQMYSGQKTQHASAVACCLFGVGPSMILAGRDLDERLVYCEPDSSADAGVRNHKPEKYYDMNGRFVNPFVGSMQPLPRGIYPLGLINCDGTIVPSSMMTYQGVFSNEDQKQNDSKLPPGTKPGGLWYQQTVSGKKRLVYREDPYGDKFYDANGSLINPRAGVMQPPLSYPPY